MDSQGIGSTLLVLEDAEARDGAMTAAPFSGANPLATSSAPVAASFAYSMIKAGPDVHADEVESDLAAIEVMILWGSTVLHVSHLLAARSFYVGESLGDKIDCDYFIPSEVLGTTRAPLVVSRGVGATLVILPRARGHVDIPGQGKIGVVDLIATKRARPSTEMSGAYEYELPANAKARIELEGSSIVFQIGAVNAGRRVLGALFSTAEPAALLYTGLSFVLHVGLVAAFAFFMPSMRGDDTEGLDRDHVLTMQKLLNAAAEREEQERENPLLTETPPDRNEGGSGTRASGEAGSMGTPNTRDSGHKYAVQGPRDNPDPHLAKQATLLEAAQFGMIGILPAMDRVDPNAPTAPWGRELSSGVDEKSARGSIFGDAIGESLGAGGLDLTSTGEGGGGPGEGIGILAFGVLDHGGGPGARQGIGNDRGGIHGGHKVTAPRPREGETIVNGRLPPDVIQRVVRLNFGRFRLCYENGMRNNPNLQGRVTAKFIIDRSGTVSMTADGGSDLPDRNVVQCVVRGFGDLSFPQPEGGVVTVVYPIIFSPGD